MDDAPRDGGQLRRRIDLASPETGEVRAWVEDDFHHFGVILHHDAHRVTGIQGIAERAPWSTCPAAAIKLRDLIGRELIPRASDVGALIDMRLHCTHLFDLAGLAMAHAAHGRGHCGYEALVADRHGPASLFQATLSLDGRIVLAWTVVKNAIVEPAHMAGQSLDAGFRAWTETLPPEEADHAFILRRTVLVAGGRNFDLDQFGIADDLGMPALCHTLQPEHRMQARREIGSTRDYSGGGGGMLAQRGPSPRIAAEE